MGAAGLTHSSSRPRLGDALALATAAFFVYCLLGQQAWYKEDGQVTLLRYVRGWPPHPSHLLSDDLLRLFGWVTRPLGLSAYVTARAWSAVSIAATLVVLHGTARLLGLTRTRAIAAMVMLACAPGLMFYATVVEFHGPLLLFASLSLLAATALGKRPTPLLAVMTGLASGLAFCVHASGAPLPALLVPWALAVGWKSQRRGKLFLWVGVAAALHAACIPGLPFVLRAVGFLPQAIDTTAGLQGMQGVGKTANTHFVNYLLWHVEQLRASEWASLPRTIAFEWLLPFAPLSVLAFWRNRSNATALQAGALAIACVPFLGTSFLLMRHADEFGAYLVPLAFAAALVAGRNVPLRIAVITSLLAAVGSIVHIANHDLWDEGDRFASQLAVVEHDGPVLLLIGEPGEANAALMHQQHRPHVQFLYVVEVVLSSLQRFDEVVSGYRKDGYRVFLTGAGRKKLATLPGGGKLLAHMSAAHRLTRGPTGGLAGEWIQAR